VLLNKRTYLLADIIGESLLVRLFVATANANIVLMGRITVPPIRHAFSEQGETTLADDDEGEEWKDR